MGRSLPWTSLVIKSCARYFGSWSRAFLLFLLSANQLQAFAYYLLIPHFLTPNPTTTAPLCPYFLLPKLYHTPPKPRKFSISQISHILQFLKI